MSAYRGFGAAAVLLACVPCLASPTRYGAAEVAELVRIAESEKEPEARRARAVRQLEHTEIRTHLSLLRRLLREERSLDIRLSAACTLASHGDGKAPKDLLLVSAYDRSRTPNCTRSDVLTALGRTKDAAAEMHLERALKDPPPDDEPFFYIDACRALRTLGTPGARRVLLLASTEGLPGVRYAALTPLSGMALDPRCPERREASELIRLTAKQDPDEKVAEQAASALFWLGVDGPGFWTLLEGDPDPRVRARAARALDRQYLSPPRIQRLHAAIEKERDPEVQAILRKTLANQRSP